MAFVPTDDLENLMVFNAILNSKAFGYLVSVQLARTELAQSYEVGLIQKTAVPTIDGGVHAELFRCGNGCLEHSERV